MKRRADGWDVYPMDGSAADPWFGPYATRGEASRAAMRLACECEKTYVIRRPPGGVWVGGPP